MATCTQMIQKNISRIYTYIYIYIYTPAQR